MAEKKEDLLINRIRKIVKTKKGYSEKQMFGGVCFMINGHMCAGNWKGSLVVRLPKEEHDSIQKEPHTSLFDITGRVMKGWALVSPKGILNDQQLKEWVLRSVKFAETLPPK